MSSHRGCCCVSGVSAPLSAFEAGIVEAMCRTGAALLGCVKRRSPRDVLGRPSTVAWAIALAFGIHGFPEARRQGSWNASHASTTACVRRFRCASDALEARGKKREAFDLEGTAARCWVSVRSWC